tara:strand:- start:594 stop:1073 length:480 start_codon:yes stop_codon:yes gene_type:complete
MARITVEDCLEKIDSQYDLVLLAKERTTQLNSGQKPLVLEDNDKNTVIALREIGDGKISLKVLEDAAINKLRKQQPESTELEDLNEEQEDSFDKIYKGEVSKSGAEILPSKRMRRTPEKMNLNNESTDVVKKDKLNDKVADSKKTDEKISLSENEKSEE